MSVLNWCPECEENTGEAKCHHCGSVTERPRHYHDTPTIREMLDKMEEKRTCDAPCLVAMLRNAVDALTWYANGQGPETRLDDNGELATTVLGNIERGLWATSPRELWFESHASESLGGGGLGKGENASPKEATDNDGTQVRAGDGASPAGGTL